MERERGFGRLLATTRRPRTPRRGERGQRYVLEGTSMKVADSDAPYNPCELLIVLLVSGETDLAPSSPLWIGRPRHSRRRTYLPSTTRTVFSNLFLARLLSLASPSYSLLLFFLLYAPRPCHPCALSKVRSASCHPRPSVRLSSVSSVVVQDVFHVAVLGTEVEL